jgi:hypothetical protein
VDGASGNPLIHDWISDGLIERSGRSPNRE